MPDIDIEINTPQIDADVGRSSTFIENDYNGLINHPSINGVELSGDKSLSDIGAASASDVAAALSGKVDKEAGKGLSSNDYTGPEKDKLAGVEAGAQVNVIESVSVNGTELAPSGKSVNVPVPTKTSDLSNDSNFPTDAEYVHTDNNFTTNEKNKLAAIESGAQVNVIESVYVNGDALVITSKGVSITIPTKVSDILNDSNFQTSAEVTAAIASAIGQITGISYSVVQELPQTGTAGVIYLVANSGSGQNIYDEYIYVNGAFEKIGTTEIDLTGYVRDANYVHTDNNYTNDEKSKLSGIASGAQVNIVESVKLNGTAITPDGNKAVNIQPGISDVSGLNDIIENANFFYTPDSEKEITLINNSDGTIILNGTSETATVYTGITLPVGTYKAKITEISGTRTGQVGLRYGSGNGTSWVTQSSNETELTFSESTYVFFRANTGTYTDYKIYISIYKTGEITAVDEYARRKIGETNELLNDFKTPNIVNSLGYYNVFTCVNKTKVKLNSDSKLLVFGDSITRGANDRTSWVTHVCNIIGCTAENKAVSGALFGESVRTDGYWLSTQLSNTTSEEWAAATLIIIAAGTNDAGYDTSYSELKTKILSAITTIKANSNAPILFITPIKRGSSKNNDNLLKLSYISGLIESVALTNDCSVICGLNFPIPSYTVGLIDGMMEGYIHPSSDGGYIYALSVIDAINNDIAPLSQDEASTGTATAQRSISAKVLHDTILELVSSGVPSAPTVAGNYCLAVTVENNTPTYTWQLISSWQGGSY